MGKKPTYLKPTLPKSKKLIYPSTKLFKKLPPTSMLQHTAVLPKVTVEEVTVVSPSQEDILLKDLYINIMCTHASTLMGVCDSINNKNYRIVGDRRLETYCASCSEYFESGHGVSANTLPKEVLKDYLANKESPSNKLIQVWWFNSLGMELPEFLEGCTEEV